MKSCSSGHHNHTKFAGEARSAEAGAASHAMNNEIINPRAILINLAVREYTVARTDWGGGGGPTVRLPAPSGY